MHAPCAANALSGTKPMVALAMCKLLFASAKTADTGADIVAYCLLLRVAGGSGSGPDFGDFHGRASLQCLLTSCLNDAPDYCVCYRGIRTGLFRLTSIQILMSATEASVLALNAAIIAVPPAGRWASCARYTPSFCGACRIREW